MKIISYTEEKESQFNYSSKGLIKLIQHNRVKPIRMYKNYKLF